MRSRFALAASLLVSIGLLPLSQAVAASSQTIAFDAVQNQILGISPFVIAAESSSLLPVGLASTTTTVCKIADDLVTLLKAGTCSITASQPGSASYSAATPVTRSFTVSVAKPSGSLIAALGSPFAARSYPDSVAVGDFNGDGIPDLALTSPQAQVVVLLGNGSGGFTAGSQFYVGGQPFDLAVGDFNGDGIQDLAVALGGSVTVLLGNGLGAFTAAAGSPFAAGDGPIFVVVGDFNGDGIQDLAVADSAGNNVSVLLGNGSGGFAAATGSPFAVGSYPSSMAVGDFNGDGVQDLAVANFDYSGVGSNSITVLLGNGSGGFTATAGSPITIFGHHGEETQPSSVAVGDFNGDGIQDLAVADVDDDSVTVLLGDGSGGFTAAAGSPFLVGVVGAFPYSVVVGDFNGDGIQDLATANKGSNNVTVLLGNGSGGFMAVPDGPFAVGANPIFAAVGDFNRDGVEDLAVVNSDENGTVTVLLGLVVGHAAQTITFGALSNVTYGVAPFVIGATASSGLAVSFASYASYYPSVCTVTGATVTIVGAGPCSIVASQAGNATYAAAATVTQSLTVNPASQTITFDALSNVSLGVSPFDVGATASSGLAVSFASTTLPICTLSGSTVTVIAPGTCTIVASQAGSTNYAAATPVARSFLVVGNPVKVAIFDNGYYFIDSNNNHKYNGPPGDSEIGWGFAGVTPVAGDWNGSGSTKVGLYYQGFWYLDYNGDGIFESGIDKVYYFGNANCTPIVGDWNGSGTTKIGIYCGGSFILDNNGDGIYEAGTDEYFGFGPTSGAQPLVGDWNHSGTSKVGVFQNGFFSLDINGDRSFVKLAGWGQANGIPVVGDWNGSGSTKIGSFSLGQYAGNPGVGQFVLDVNGDYSYEPGEDALFPWGDTNSIPVVGDWNGDGRSKIGVVSNGIWVLDLNGNFMYDLPAEAPFQFGGCGAASYPCGQIPVPAHWQ